VLIFAPPKEKNMSRVCQLTGKKVLVGNNVSHSNKRTKRKFYPNLQVKKFYIPELDEYITLKISTSALRTINKKGIYQYLKELEKEGTKILK
jgi:large subunit ribosomal protein L28